MEETMEKCLSASQDYRSPEFVENYQILLTGKMLIEEKFLNESLYKIFNSGKFIGRRMLDFGCGPTFHRMAPASLHFKEIYLADYSESNRKELEKWMKGDSKLLWTPLMEQCARLEKFDDLAEGVRKIESRIKYCIKEIVPCNILAENILPKDLGEFDLITSFCVVESCCFSEKLYIEAMKKLGQYIKKGGAIIMINCLNATKYCVHKEMPIFSLTEDLIKSTLKEIGFLLNDWYYLENIEKRSYGEYSGWAVFSAIKL